MKWYLGYGVPLEAENNSQTQSHNTTREHAFTIE